MKLIIHLIYFISLISPKISDAQTNLANNPSFENFTNCPTGISQIDYCEEWDNVGGSPDYFNACASISSGCSVPSNIFGYQLPSSGNAYAGFYAKDESSGYREFLGTLLSYPLQIGIEYFISIKVCLSTYPYRNEYCGVNKIGVLFSSLPFSSTNPPEINNFAHIYTNDIIIDTSNWIMIKGSFIADSNFTYVGIGNFFADLLTDSVQIVGDECHAYYFLDDICISTDSAYCNNYIYNNISKVESPTISIWPNPSHGNFNVELLNIEGTYDLFIYTLHGKEIYKSVNNRQSKILLDLNFTDENIFYIKIKQFNSFYIQKLIKK